MQAKLIVNSIAEQTLTGGVDKFRITVELEDAVSRLKLFPIGGFHDEKAISLNR